MATRETDPWSGTCSMCGRFTGDPQFITGADGVDKPLCSTCLDDLMDSRHSDREPVRS